MSLTARLPSFYWHCRAFLSSLVLSASAFYTCLLASAQEGKKNSTAMKMILKKYKLELAGLVIGGISGWCYWHFVGCTSGTCPITSKPLNSSVYGSVMGVLLFSLFKKEK